MYFSNLDNNDTPAFTIEDQLEQLQDHLNPSDLPSDSSSSEDNSEEDDVSNYVAYHNLGYDPLGK